MTPGVLTAHVERVVERVLDEESTRRSHLVVGISGAHAYGFPSPDSDVDLKAIHVTPTPDLLGLSPPETHASRVEVIEGVEIDYGSNEIQPVLVGILGGNGNYFERILGALSPRTSPALESLRPIVRRALSRRVHRHYRGFSSGQLHDLDESTAPTAKKVLYVLRTALTGTHLLRTGDLVVDVTLLLEEYGFGSARPFVEAKRAGERTVLDADLVSSWRARLGRAIELVDEARERSVLPEEAPNRAEIEAWLLELRRSG